MINYYKILEVSQDSSFQDIRSSYRRLAMKWHPDKNSNNKAAEEKFKKIPEAYSILNDPELRNEYNNSFAGFKDESINYNINSVTAAKMFINEMINMAYELSMENISWSKIVDVLVERGGPENIASEISRSVEKHRKARVRKSAKKSLIWALGSILLGLIITGISYSATSSGGRYLVASGLFLYGTLNIFRALYFILSGRVPKNHNLSGIEF